MGPQPWGWREGGGCEAVVRSTRERKEATQRRRRSKCKANLSFFFFFSVKERERKRERDWATQKKLGNEWSWEGGKERNQPLKNSDLTTSKS